MSKQKPIEDDAIRGTGAVLAAAVARRDLVMLDDGLAMLRAVVKSGTWDDLEGVFRAYEELAPIAGLFYRAIQ